MASAPKTLTLQDLSGAVRLAVEKVKMPPHSGPYLIINPGIICGLIYAGKLTELREAEQIAATIAKQVSSHIGVTVAPVVQEVGATAAVKGEHALAIASGLKPGHIILGYRALPEQFVSFGH